ncbi:MAG: 30S ribosomal protein S20 [Candidatus Amoebophilus sp.]
MPNKKSAKKELRKGNRRAQQNSAAKDSIKLLRKQTAKAILAKETGAKELAAKTIKALDKAAGKGILKKNTVSRTKSRLQKKINAVGK